MNCRVLIVTNRDDLHAHIVAEKIATMCDSPFRLNLDDFPRDYAVTIVSTCDRWDGELTHIPTGDCLPLSSVGSVWLRKPADYQFLSKDMGAQERHFACAEIDHFLFGLFHSFNCYWMSHPTAIRRAQWKCEQLLRAARMGFRVPASLVTNCPEPAHTFRDAMRRDIIFKTLSSPSLAAEKVSPQERVAYGLPTTRIADDDEDLLDALAEVPCLFQEYIPKRYEVRVTVIGDEVFAARINSQDDPRTATDFRDFTVEIKYEVERLPPEIQAKCLEFVKSYQLTYGAIDLIVTPDDEYVFLENNPAGQFLFVEELVPELTMSDSLARQLVQGSRARE